MRRTPLFVKRKPILHHYSIKVYLVVRLGWTIRQEAMNIGGEICEPTLISVPWLQGASLLY